MELTTVWVLLIVVLWAGYLALEGFDFGVGALSRVLGRDEAERGHALESIGPVWDGNEVWVITAIGATFAAFPEWYATLLSTYYLPAALILFALIGRNVALEYREKRTDLRWRRRCDRVVAGTSLVPPLLWGLILAGTVGGLPLDADGEFTGTVLDLLSPFALAGAVAVLVLSLFHGATYLALKTTGTVHARARTAAVPLGVLAAAAGSAMVWWTLDRSIAGGTELGWLVAVLAAGTTASLVLAVVAAVRGREGAAFTGSTGGIVLLVFTWFASIFPTVMPSTSNPAWSLTKDNAASESYTLTLMTWIAAFFLPVVLGYIGWVYWTFRHRVGTPLPPADRGAATLRGGSPPH